MRRLLLVTQRPLDYGGGASVRWQYLCDALPQYGWKVAEVSARPNPTANAASTDPRVARLAAARAKVMSAIGGAVRPVYRRLGIQPEAFPPNALWSLTGRPAVRRARDRTRPDVVWATCPPPSALFAALPVRSAATPLVAEMRDLWAGNPYFDAGGRLLTRIEKGAFARANAVVTVTDSCASRMVGLHPEIAPRLEVLPNGFDPALLDLRGRAGGPTSAPPSSMPGRSTATGRRSRCCGCCRDRSWRARSARPARCARPRDGRRAATRPRRPRGRGRTAGALAGRRRARPGGRRGGRHQQPWHGRRHGGT